jgi:hypothetical protein
LKLINLTPHPVNIHKEDGRIVVVPTSGRVARVITKVTGEGHIDLDNVDIPVTIHTTLFVTGLPPKQEGVIFIVSEYVQRFIPLRRDIVSPTDVIRQKGRTTGCRGLKQVVSPNEEEEKTDGIKLTKTF